MVSARFDDAARDGATPTFRQLWVAETVRLRESQWGPCADSAEVRDARHRGAGFAERLLLRAAALGEREGITAQIRQWAAVARLSLLLLAMGAVVGGALAAQAILGAPGSQVNLLMALTGLLGLHVITLLIWLVTLVLPSHDAHASLGELWLWLTRKLARGPMAGLVLRGLLGLLGRRGALAPALACISHGAWLLALGTMAVTLTGLLSARRYTFHWETTLLAPETVQTLTATLGWLPRQLGFAVPPDAIVRISDGLHRLPDTAHAQWSGWLIGCVVLYGVLPRALVWLGSAIVTRRRLAHLQLETGLPGFAELRDRLAPQAQSEGIDAPAPDALTPSTPAYASGKAPQAAAAFLGIEIPPDASWPPAGLAEAHDLGVVDTRAQRVQALNRLQATPPQRLLLVCDADQTPDRGTLMLIRELATLAAQTGVVALAAQGAGAVSRQATWVRFLTDGGLAPGQIFTDASAAGAWLQTQTAPGSGASHHTP